MRVLRQMTRASRNPLRKVVLDRSLFPNKNFRKIPNIAVGRWAFPKYAQEYAQVKARFDSEVPLSSA
jgi:hypothetical protein